MENGWGTSDEDIRVGLARGMGMKMASMMGERWIGYGRVVGMRIGIMKVGGRCRHETGNGKGSMGLERSGGMHGHGNGYMHGYDSNGWGSVDEQQGYCGEGAMMTKFSFLSLQIISII